MPLCGNRRSQSTPRREEPCFTRNLAVGRMILDLFLYFPPSPMKNSYLECEETRGKLYSISDLDIVQEGSSLGNIKRESSLHYGRKSRHW